MVTCPSVKEISNFIISSPPKRIYTYGDFIVKVFYTIDKETEHVFENETKVLQRLAKFPPLKKYLPIICWSRKVEDTGIIVQKKENAVDLQTYLNENKTIPFEFGYALFGHIRAAIEALHRTGYIHRDIKPSNILVRNDSPIPVLIDYGLICKMPCHSFVVREGSPGFIPNNWINTEQKRRNYFITDSKTRTMRSIKVSQNTITPMYSKYSDNYALYVTLKALFVQIDWTGHEAIKHETEIYLNRLGGQMVGQLAAQYAIESGKAERPPSSKNSNGVTLRKRFATPAIRKSKRNNNNNKNNNKNTGKRPMLNIPKNISYHGSNESSTINKN